MGRSKGSVSGSGSCGRLALSIPNASKLLYEYKRVHARICCFILGLSVTFNAAQPTFMFQASITPADILLRLLTIATCQHTLEWVSEPACTFTVECSKTFPPAPARSCRYFVPRTGCQRMLETSSHRSMLVPGILEPRSIDYDCLLTLRGDE